MAAGVSCLARLHPALEEGPHMSRLPLLVTALLSSFGSAFAADVVGHVLQRTSPLRGAAGSTTRPGVKSARVTLFTQGLGYFQEARTDSQGLFAFRDVPPGTYRLGASARGLEYIEREVA